MQNRSRLVAEGLTALAAYAQAGRPPQGLRPFGSFEGWSDFVRSAIVWAGFNDPVERTVANESGADPEQEAHVRALVAWRELFGSDAITASDALKLLGERPQGDRIRDAVIELCATQGGELPSARQLGVKLASLQGRIRSATIEGEDRLLAFCRAVARQRTGVARWRVTDKGRV